MRRTVALWLMVSSLACGGAAGLAAPAALAAGSSGVTISTNSLTSATPSPQPSFNLSNGGAAATPQQTNVTQVPTTTSTSSGGLSGLDALIIAVVAALLLGGIAFWVWYDARGHAARVGHDEPLFGQRAHAGSKSARKPRKLKPAERKRRKRGRAR